MESAQKVFDLQSEYKTALQELENERSKRNELSKKIGMIRAKEGPEAAAAALKEANTLKESMQALEEKTTALKAEIEKIMLTIPNLPDISVPVGADDKANVVVKENTLPIKAKYIPKHINSGWTLKVSFAIRYCRRQAYLRQSP